MTTRYELWASLTNNLVDTYSTAIHAEHRIKALVKELGHTELDRFSLSCEGENEADDALIGEGLAILPALRELALTESHSSPTMDR